MVGQLLVAMMAVTATDQTVPVTKGTKLEVNNFAGDVAIKVWDKDSVRVEVNHSDREVVDIKPGEQTLSVRSRSVRGGPPRSLDYTITVPKWMAIGVSGTYADVSMDGVGGDITVETTRGDIDITGGSGVITLKSIQGIVNLQKAKGRIEVRAVNEGMHLADISGDLSAETTNGSIILDRVDSGNVDLYTVNGNISYDGPIKDKGVYRLTTHNGMIAVAVPERVNATLMVRTYNGSFKSTFPVKQDDQQNPRKRFTLTLGNGSAHLELESFGGTISLRRPGEPRPEVEREKRKRDRADNAIGLAKIAPSIHPEITVVTASVQADIDRAVNEAMRDVQPEIDRAVNEAMRDVQPEIDRAVNEAMRDAQPEIDRAVSEAMREGHPMPMPVPMPMPRPRPW